MVLAAVAVMSVSCGRKELAYTPAEVAEVYDGVGRFASMSPGEQSSFIGANYPALDALWKVVGHGELSVDALARWSRSAAVTVFTPSTDSVFAVHDPLPDALGYALAAAGEIGLELPERYYAEVVWGKRESIMFVDSVMLVAMNHYLGTDYPGYSGWPGYVRSQKTPQALPYDVAEALACTAMPYQTTDGGCTLLRRMLYEGATVEARMELVRGSSPAAALGYSEDEYEWLCRNESGLWHTLVAGKYLFDTSETAASRILSPSPATRILHPEAPGRAGRFIGFRLVRSYLTRHPETDVGFLLSPEFYGNPDILKEIGYAPAGK